MSHPLTDISTIAERFVKLVADSTERIIIAGSIRRKRPFANDIDIVAISKVVEGTKEAWFAPIKTRESLLHKTVQELLRNNTIKARVKIDGKTMIGESVAFIIYEDVPLDLYYATEPTWWGLVQMRTGSARFNSMLATRALSMGLKYHADGGGVTKNGVRLDDGKGEEGIFKALDLKYLPPENRD